MLPTPDLQKSSILDAQRTRHCYLLVKLEELHRHIALELRPGPAGKHPKSCDDHRVEDFEIQGDG